MKSGAQRPPVSFADSIQVDANNQKKTLGFKANANAKPETPPTVFKASGQNWTALCVSL